MNASGFIAARLRFKGKIAMVAIAISFFVIILAVSISSGFRTGLRAGIARLSGDIQITQPDLNYASEHEPLDISAPAMDAVRENPAVQECIPSVYRAGIVRNGTEIVGVMFKGTSSGGDSLSVSIPTRLATMTGLKEGDDMLAYFVGERVRARKFKVGSVYRSVLTGNDNIVVFAGLKDMQRLNGWKADEVSALELVLKSQYRDNHMLEAVTDEIGDSILQATPEDGSAPLAVSVLNRYPQIFSWLDIIDFNVVIILILMTIVAGFNMISGLLILLFRNISTIGILKSMGMTDRSISEVFLRVSSNLVLKGMLAGNALALLFCLVQGVTHVIKLNPENYFLSYVPVHVNPLVILAADLIAYLVIMVLLTLPCLFVSRVDPAKTVRTQ